VHQSVAFRCKNALKITYLCLYLQKVFRRLYSRSPVKTGGEIQIERWDNREGYVVWSTRGKEGEKEGTNGEEEGEERREGYRFQPSQT
jgi:hypothetical protein